MESLYYYGYARYKKLSIALCIDKLCSFHHTKNRSLCLGRPALCIWCSHRLILYLVVFRRLIY